MWEPLARALGWPRKPMASRDILELATTKSRAGPRHGLPTYGHFKLGQANPGLDLRGCHSSLRSTTPPPASEKVSR